MSVSRKILDRPFPKSLRIHRNQWNEKKKKKKVPFKKNYLFLAVLGLPNCSGFSLVTASGDVTPVAVLRLIVAVASCCRAQALGHSGFSSCSTWAQ